VIGNRLGILVKGSSIKGHSNGTGEVVLFKEPILFDLPIFIIDGIIQIFKAGYSQVLLNTDIQMLESGQNLS
jgi:hypothetical protein